MKKNKKEKTIWFAKEKKIHFSSKYYFRFGS